MFSPKDLEQIRNKGIGLPVIEKQIEHFQRGFPFIGLDRPATAGDGIISFSPEQKAFFIHYFEKNKGSCRMMKFVPASGAATRMFRHLFEFRASFDGSDKSYRKYLEDQSFNSVYYFISHIEKLAFYDDLTTVPALAGKKISRLIEDHEPGLIIGAVLDENGLNYSSLPKALLKFHRYPEGARTALEEHLVEAFHYTRDDLSVARIHFTVSPEHRGKFMEKIEEVRNGYETRYGVKIDAVCSVQKSSTDTIAVDEYNIPFRNEDGTLLFRPAGHGALLENLDETDTDVIFIKNIDNIVPDRLKGPTFEYKMLTGGYLLWIRDRIREYLLKVLKDKATPVDTEKIAEFAAKDLMLLLPPDFHELPEQNRQQVMKELLNRPVRVCGMVKNAGEPGGGPYWVSGSKGGNSLQIVESSQVNLMDDTQKNIFSRATHFNPVDLVCSIRDFQDNKFNLREFTDEDTGFISFKSSGGRTLKAQELPGLWNGSMAKWITLFAEVPIITFNPVKTVNDLLRIGHQ